MRHAQRHRARVRVALERVEGVAHRASLRAESSGPGEVRGGDLRARATNAGYRRDAGRRRRFAAAVSSRGGGGGGDGGGGGVVVVVLAVARDVIAVAGDVLAVARDVVVVVPRLAESGPREAGVVGGGGGRLRRSETGSPGGGGGRTGVAPGGVRGGGDVAAKRADARVLGLVIGPVAEGGVGAAVVRRGEIESEPGSERSS